MGKAIVTGVERIRTMSTLDRVCAHCGNSFELRHPSDQKETFEHCPHCGCPGQTSGTEHYPKSKRE